MKNKHGGHRTPAGGRPKTKTQPKTAPVSIGQTLTHAERARILRLIPAEERGALLLAEAKRRDEATK